MEKDRAWPVSLDTALGGQNSLKSSSKPRASRRVTQIVTPFEVVAIDGPVFGLLGVKNSDTSFLTPFAEIYDFQ
jgi:hypothetical protein